MLKIAFTFHHLSKSSFNSLLPSINRNCASGSVIILAFCCCMLLIYFDVNHTITDYIIENTQEGRGNVEDVNKLLKTTLMPVDTNEGGRGDCDAPEGARREWRPLQSTGKDTRIRLTHRRQCHLKDLCSHNGAGASHCRTVIKSYMIRTVIR